MRPFQQPKSRERTRSAVEDSTLSMISLLWACIHAPPSRRPAVGALSFEHPNAYAFHLDRVYSFSEPHGEAKPDTLPDEAYLGGPNRLRTKLGRPKAYQLLDDDAEARDFSFRQRKGAVVTAVDETGGGEQELEETSLSESGMELVPMANSERGRNYEVVRNAQGGEGDDDRMGSPSEIRASSEGSDVDNTLGPNNGAPEGLCGGGGLLATPNVKILLLLVCIVQVRA